MITGAEPEQSWGCVTTLIVIRFCRLYQLLNTSLIMTCTNSKKKAAQKVDKKRQQHIAVFGAAFAAVAVAAATALSRPVPIPKHTSVLTGLRWLND